MPHPYDNIPALLKQRPNWVAWGIRDAPLKAPFNPDSNSNKWGQLGEILGGVPATRGAV